MEGSDDDTRWGVYVHTSYRLTTPWSRDRARVFYSLGRGCRSILVKGMMGRILKVHLVNASPDLVHSFRNFGEDVYRTFRDHYGVSIEEIDASTREFHIREIPNREVRTCAARVRKIAEKCRNLAINVDEVKEHDND